MVDTVQGYALSNDRPGTADMLNCLSGVLDEPTIGLLAPLVPVGGRCLELGAGNGTIAAWMATAAGPHGEVLATDLQPHHIRQPQPGVTVLRHDLRNEPLPPGLFNVIHSRLLLAHLPQRDKLVPQLADKLKPGGYLLVEEWGAGGPAQVLSSPWPNTAGLYERYQEALIATFAAAGNDPTWSRRVHAVMEESGLTEVTTRVHARSWAGGTPGCQLPLAVSDQLRAQLADRGMTLASLDLLREQLADPRVVLLGNLTWSVTGRRAEG
jgi:SAM-dependent methyltransferase